MKIVIVTMAYNERVNLPIWLRHYRAHCPGASLFVLDHGSDDGSTRDIEGAAVIPLPLTPFDDGNRCEALSDFQRALLKYFDVVIYTDCDEMLVADPRRYGSLAEFLAARPSDLIAPTGLNVQHIIGLHEPIDLSAPILRQRPYVVFASPFCKPLVTRVPVGWSPGFHGCDRRAEFAPDLFLFHLHKMDLGLSLAKLKLTREMPWSARSAGRWGDRARESDADHIALRFAHIAKEFGETGVASPFEFSAELARVEAGLIARGAYLVAPPFRGPVCRVPEEFMGLF